MKKRNGASISMHGNYSKDEYNNVNKAVEDKSCITLIKILNKHHWNILEEAEIIVNNIKTIMF